MRDGRARLAPIPVLGLAVIAFHGRALVIAPQDHVDDAGDGVRTVDGRGAILEDFHPFHRFQGDDVQVGKHFLAVVGQAVGRHAAPVQQDQGRRRAQAAQRDARRAGGKAAAEAGRDRTLVVDGQGLQQFGHAGLARFLDIGRIQGLYGRGCFSLGAADVRAGDFHALQGRRCSIVLCQDG